jgi:hypothetical protein
MRIGIGPLGDPFLMLGQLQPDRIGIGVGTSRGSEVNILQVDVYVILT